MNDPDRASGVLVVIPARLASTRLPRKPLADVGGDPLIVHVLRNARGIAGATAVVVATDSEEIASAVRAAGGEAVLTSVDCASGTDRVAEVAAARDEEIVVNVQGDEPELPAADVDRLIATMKRDSSLRMGTLAAPAEEGEFERPSVVKVVCDGAGRAVSFSRTVASDRTAPARGPMQHVGPMRHVGVYAFRRAALLEFAALPPTELERTERLEQLRAIEHGWSIAVVVGERAPAGIDTVADLEAFRERWTAHSQQGHSQERSA